MRAEIGSGDVHVIQFHLGRRFEDDGRLLDRHEQERADRFVLEHDRWRFIAAHACMRVVLGAYMDRAPEALRFAHGERGKPHVLDSPIDVRFSLSHSGERAVLALALGQEVGVDIEQERDTAVIELAQRFFSVGEVEALRKVSRAERVPAFFRCWTKKEAVVKAMGDGLSCPLEAFEVGIDSSPSERIVEARSPLTNVVSSWRVVSIQTEAPYTAAVASGPASWRLTTYGPMRFEQLSGASLGSRVSEPSSH